MKKLSRFYLVGIILLTAALSFPVLLILHHLHGYCAVADNHAARCLRHQPNGLFLQHFDCSCAISHIASAAAHRAITVRRDRRKI